MVARSILVLLTFSVGVYAEIQINGGATGSAIICDDGRVQTLALETLGYVRDDGQVEDRHFRCLGYGRGDGRVEDSDHRVIGYIKPDGTLEDRNRKLVAYLRAGYLLDASSRNLASYRVAGTADRAMRDVALYFFFFTRTIFRQPDWVTALAEAN